MEREVILLIGERFSSRSKAIQKKKNEMSICSIVKMSWCISSPVI